MREIVKQVTVTESLLNGRTCTWKSTNKLLLADDEKHYNPYVTGMKTGSGDTTYCLTVSAEKDGRRLLLVLMGARKEEDRWTDAQRPSPNRLRGLSKAVRLLSPVSE